QSAAQIGSIVDGHTAGQLYATIRFTVATQHRSFGAKRQARDPQSRHFQQRDEHHIHGRVSCSEPGAYELVQPSGPAPASSVARPPHRRPAVYPAVPAVATLAPRRTARSALARLLPETAAARTPGAARRSIAGGGAGPIR